MDEGFGLMAEQEALTELGQALASALSPGDTALVLKASVLAPTSGGQLLAMNPDGAFESPEGRFNYADMPTAAIIALEKLRAAAYRESVGTWYSIRLTLTVDGSVSAEYNYDDEPEWDAPIDPVAYLTDLTKFPRSPEHQPEWLTAKIEEARTRRPSP